MLAKENLTPRQSELLSDVAKGDVDPSDPVELVALLNLERLGFLTSEHDDDGFTFKVVKGAGSKKKKSADDSED